MLAVAAVTLNFFFRCTTRKFQLNPSSRLGEVLDTRFGDGRTYRGCLSKPSSYYIGQKTTHKRPNFGIVEFVREQTYKQTHISICDLVSSIKSDFSVTPCKRNSRTKIHLPTPSALFKGHNLVVLRNELSLRLGQKAVSEVAPPHVAHCVPAMVPL